MVQVNGFVLRSVDSPPQVQFAAAAASGLETETPANLPVVVLSPPQPHVVTVDYAATGGTATGGGVDYTLTPGTLTFNPGDTVKTISMAIVDDGLDDEDETVVVSLVNPTGGVGLGSASDCTYTILDPRPFVGFTAESSKGSETVSPADLTVILSETWSQTVTVDYAVTGGTATGGGVDYTLDSGILTFEPGETSRTISIVVVDDNLPEVDETVLVTLSNAVHAKDGITNHTFKIEDDDITPSILADLGNGPVQAGWVFMPTCGEYYNVAGSGIDVTLATGDPPACESRDPNWGLTGSGPLADVETDLLFADNRRGADADFIITFTGLTPGTPYQLESYHTRSDAQTAVPIAAVTVTGGVDVLTPGPIAQTRDIMDNPAQTQFTAVGTSVTVRYVAASNGMVQVNGFTLASVDAPPQVQFAAAAASGLETESPASLPVVVLSPPQPNGVTVDYAVTGGTATAGVDYLIATGGSVCWNSATQCHGDTDATGDVKGSDFLAFKNSWYLCDTDLNYNPCADFDRDGCVKGSDFLILKNNWYQTVEANCPLESGATLEFAPGETSKTININIVNDDVAENDETIVLTLSNPIGGEVKLGGIAALTYTINDRPAVEFENDSTAAVMEDLGPIVITVKLSHSYEETVTVDYAAVGGTATAGDDYIMTPGTLTFAPGETSQTITIELLDDMLPETPETILIELSNPTNAQLGTIRQHTANIRDPLHLKVDLALPMQGTRDPWPGTAKEGWWHFIAGRWYDMYAHDCVWECYEGQAGLHAKDLCRCNLAGDCPPSGTIQGDPIANTWLYAVDWATPPSGDTVLIITDLPSGTYELKSYHNHWEPGEYPGDQGGRNCCRCKQPMPPLPSITAQSLPSSGIPKPGYSGLCVRGDDGGVTAIDNAYDVPVTYVYNDDEVSTSLIKFYTDGRPVLVIYEAPDWGFPDCARQGREGGRGILNAFEIMRLGH
ncbi:MAG: Calx-beta domain-containing protein [Planctomycetota bacterium]